MTQAKNGRFDTIRQPAIGVNLIAAWNFVNALFTDDCLMFFLFQANLAFKKAKITCRT